MEIKFGTSGWRGVISEDFTFKNVEIVAQAISDYIKQSQVTPRRFTQRNDTRGQASHKSQVVVGYDTRFFGEEFAQTMAQVLTANNIKVLLTKRDTPTPVIAFEILRQKAGGGVNFTASHNPYQYNGIKFSPSWGGPALPQDTQIIERNCQKYLAHPKLVNKISFEEGVKKGLVRYIDPRPAYLKRLSNLVDLAAIKKAKLKIGIDLLYGTGRRYLDEILQKAGCDLKILNDWRDVLFGGHPPEPSLENLPELVALVKKQHYNLGLGVDGDADRFGIIDNYGEYISPGHVIAMLLDHLVKERRWDGVVARSVMTTSFIDAVAKNYDIPVRETPVGFKYIGDILVKEDLIIGGEESGGLTIRGHVPEKDGILACLLVAEMVAKARKPLQEILQKLYKKFGVFIFQRINFHLTPERMEELEQELTHNPPQEIAQAKVVKTITIDGFKFILEDGSWVGLRLSGTEPVVRYYIETNTQAKFKKLVAAGKKLINGKR